MKIKILAARVSCLLPLAFGPVAQGSQSSPLVVQTNETEDTHFIMGYALWFGDSDTYYSWDKSNYNPTLQDFYKGEQEEDIAQGDPLVKPGGLFVGTPNVTSTLTSLDTSSGAGYYSYDPEVIEYHAGLLDQMGIDIIGADLTNNVYLDFAGGSSSGPIRDGSAAVYSSDPQGTWNLGEHPPKAGSVKADAEYVSFRALLETLDNLAESGPHDLKVVPTLGAAWDANPTNGPDVPPDDAKYNDFPASLRPLPGDTLSPFQYQLKWALTQLNLFPNRKVIYEGKPLVMVFVAFGGPHKHVTIPADPYYNPNQTVVAMQLEIEQQAADLASLYGSTYAATIRTTGGFHENDSQTWMIKPETPDPNKPGSFLISQDNGSDIIPMVRTVDRLWSYQERLNGWYTNAYSAYTGHPQLQRAEFASVSTTSGDQVLNGVTAPNSWLPARNGGHANVQMSMAKTKNPLFVFLSKWNHFISHDSGFTQETTTDMEPTLATQWGSKVYDGIKNAISSYKAYKSGGGQPRFGEFSLWSGTGSGNDAFIVGFEISGNAGQRVFIKGMGKSLEPIFGPSTLIADPIIDLTSANTGWVGTNYNWNDPRNGATYPLDGNVVQDNNSLMVSSFNLGQTTKPEESAITADLKPGVFSALLRDGSSTGKLGFMRLLPMDEISDSRLIGVGFRARTKSSAQWIVAGFTLDRPMTVALRGSGPSLSAFGLSPVMSNPRIDLYGPMGVITSTDIDASTKAQLQPRYPGWTIHPNEAGLKVNLQPGAYSVILQSEGGGSLGIGHLSILEW